MIIQSIEKLLKILFPTRVSFDDGSYIEYFNREAIIYCDVDSERKMEIIWDFQPHSVNGRVLSRSDISYWDSPNEGQTLDIEQRKMIEKKIVEYCKIRKISLKVIDN